MASPPASTKTSLGQKLRERARQRWPQLAGIGVRFRGQFAYITGKLPDGSELPLCRLRYVGYASTWGFAIYRASHDDYQDNYLPGGQPSGTPEEALDCACGLYLGDPTAWLTPPGADTPTDLQAGALVPDLVVAGVLQDAAPGGLEDPAVRGGAGPLDVRAEQPDQDRGDGMVRVSLSARCFGPRSWRAVPSSVQARPARDAEAERTIHPQPAFGRCRSASRSMTASDGRSAA